jgi:hypothetical protein
MLSTDLRILKVYPVDNYALPVDNFGKIPPLLEVAGCHIRGISI